ncbi:sigma-70 family RNA polymerase sigma factor [Pediococcus pentosaceus]|uniref:sigma-70 family RNA polymerase sigma factor n=1 Tax=Pediococcus pentosaceus TaxID=1255 RepID=UPI000B4BEF1E|nr:sigma-70 family RNA polymerase sigma factor [Pediococcus pentosaceus]ASC09221.1 hypothetical protein S100194_01719 [Pediococcus pentosaceus]MCZ3392657.1 sigma-70 family RNA polymerase sigma factor [Enterococcus faecium]WFC00136.1 sigma-70 family RNA polymerase sigma factor [Pediococcus pentosaceus]
MRTGSRFDWLKDYLSIDEDIRYLKWKINKMKAEEERWSTGDLFHIHLEAKSTGSHTMDNYEEYQKQVEALQQEQKALLALVNTFKGYSNDLLRLKYIEGKTLEEIAEILGYSESAIQRKRAELHRCLDWLDHWEETKDQLENRLDYQTK